MLEELLPESKHGAVAELKSYFLGSFGHPVRIDYGTGHETSFMIFLCTEFPRLLRQLGCKSVW